MSRTLAIALVSVVSLAPLTKAQDAPPAPAPPVVPVVPAGRGGDELGVEGAAGVPTRVPELLARTPPVARASGLLGAEVFDQTSEVVAHLDDLVVREDGRLVAILGRPNGTQVGLPFDELQARAKPDLEGGSGRVTIRSFGLAPVSRRLESAPEIEDLSRIDAEWLARLDAGVAPAPAKPEAPEPDAPPEPDAAAPAAPGDSAPTTTPAVPTAPEPATPGATAGATPGASDASATPPIESVALPLVSGWIGGDALDSDGQPAGRLADVIVDVSKARVAYLVLIRPATPEEPESVRALAFAALAPRDADGSIRLSLDAPELDHSPRLDLQSGLPVDPFESESGKPAARRTGPAEIDSSGSRRDTLPR